MPTDLEQRAQFCEARVALIGAGTISSRYVESLQQSPGFFVDAVCSHHIANAQNFAKEYGLTAYTIDDMLALPAINYILNLTPASEHAAITTACLKAGKSVYSEKPLAHTLDEADAMIKLADRRGLLLACAPATFLWPPLATATQIVMKGQLGKIAGALSTLVYPGPELFHPNPAQLYDASAGPLRDMGVYQVTALLALLGPVEKVSAFSSRSRAQRHVLVGENAGQSFRVDVDTHWQAQLLHSSGAVSTLIVSFDAVSASRSRLDLFGANGGLKITNPHSPEAQLKMKLGTDREEIVVAEPEWCEASWGVGPIEAWNAHHSHQIISTSARRARDVLEILIALENAAASGNSINVSPSITWNQERHG